MKKIALRMDDVGASSKRYEVYSKKFKGLGNILFLKYLPGLKAWGPYAEMNAQQWQALINFLIAEKAKLTVGITATWVEHDGSLVPFPEKFPEVVPVIKHGIAAGVLEIASHGLTHCVLKDHLFRPHPFKSNRTYHREFWDWLPEEVHQSHVLRSKEILEQTFGKITTLIPPGNVFADATLRAARQHGFKTVNCKTSAREWDGLKIIGNDNIIAFHDKEIVEEGIEWLAKKIRAQAHAEFVFVRDLL